MHVFKTLFMTWTGFALTMASVVIPVDIRRFFRSNHLYIIVLSSTQKLSTTYHRIMTFVSLCDIIASVCMALATIPMPTDNVVYTFDGPMVRSFSTWLHSSSKSDFRGSDNWGGFELKFELVLRVRYQIQDQTRNDSETMGANLSHSYSWLRYFRIDSLSTS